MDRGRLRIGLLLFLLLMGVIYISKRTFSSLDWLPVDETARKPVPARYVVLNDFEKRKRATTHMRANLSSRRKITNSGRLGITLPVHRYNILFWTKFYGDTFVPALRLYQEAVDGLKKCPYPNCDVISDRGSISNSSAVIFHIRDFLWEDVPQQRLSDQYYTFYGLESPVHTSRDLDRISGFFNLTFTYRLDSDVVTDSYFQHFRPTVWNGEEDFRALWKVKKKFAVIFVSNCHPPSRRDAYVQNLAKYVDIDIYGDCGTKHCSRDRQEECDKLVEKYKFYLAFENSVCKDYVTEKIHRAFNHGTIPVVYGGANYTAIFPEKSVISVLDYESPKLLARYLLYLDKTPQDYKQYFIWRMRPATVALATNLEPSNLSWCKICTLLNTQSPKTKRVVSDLSGWWNTKGWCVVPEVGRGDVEGLWEGMWQRNPAIPKD